MKRSALVALVLVAACSNGTSTATRTPTPSASSDGQPSATASSSTYRVDVVASDFSANVTNAWFPLPAKARWVYRGADEDGPVREVVTVGGTEKVGGVPCRVVLDRLYHDGELSETTKDFYAQDSHGDVWYFGEDTAELEADGSMVTTEGTWHYGVTGGQPGIVMTAVPALGDTHRQEYLAGQAEDYYAVDGLAASATTPYRSFTHLLQTREWTPLEPGVVSRKLYARGIGLVKELNTTGPQETLSLVSFSR